MSKVFSVVFPGLIIGLLNVQAVTYSTGGFVVVAYITSKGYTDSHIYSTDTKIVFTSLSIGGVLLILILYKYVKTRRLVAG